jgi:predicted transcriptional regulator
VKGVMLNKAKLESHINNKLNETDWKILNLLYDDPIIMNKIIAQEVSLSVEGVSSSLRKMYRLFVIKDGKNKKIALLLESIRISSNN